MPSRPSEWRRTASTLFLRVPRVDWSLICTGAKSEFRASGKGARHGTHQDLPRPVVAYSYAQYRTEPDQQLLVLEDSWVEPLGAISAQSLEREGFASMTDFRRYWRERHDHRLFKPLSRVQVYHVRPWRPADLEAMGEKLIRDLYGPWL